MSVFYSTCEETDLVTFFKIHFICMGILCVWGGILPAYMSVFHVYAVHMEARRGPGISWASYEWLRTDVWVLGTKPTILKE